MQKSCLVISYGPVPTPEHQTVEGGGMRAWGLAKGLQANGVETTVAINQGFPQTISEHEGIKLTSWNLDAEFIKIINSYDAVIVSYCMGDVSVFVADNINDETLLILDCYVPIYIEVSARDAKDMDTEYVNYMADLKRHNHTLKRGDYFLYANAAQEQLYTGVLSALGIINPYSYKTNRLLYAPFGIHREDVTAPHNPYKDLGISKDDFVVLWFGGIYPWFRIEEYLGAIKQLSKNPKFKFVFVGGKNPFNSNEDIARQYTKTLEFSKENNLTDTTVHFIDWVDFNTRINWFQHADVIISLNQPGEENKYSWRTRVMDFVWGEAATITNGGDPLSEEMVSTDAAIRLDSLSAESIVKTLEKIQSQPSILKKVRSNVRKLKDKYYWDVTTKTIEEAINQNNAPYVSESKLRQLAGLDGDPSEAPLVKPASKLQKAASLPIKITKKVRQKGVRRTTRIAIDIVNTQIKQRIPAKRERQFVFISHPIDNTGAPAVLLQIIEEYVEKYGSSRIRVIAPGATKNQENYLKSLGVRVEKAVYGASFRFIRLQLGLQPDDFVMLNTIAVYDSYRDFILLWLKLGRLNHANWFIHEDPAQIPIINEGFLSADNISRVKSLAANNRISLFYPSLRTSEEYGELLEVDGTPIKLHVDVPDKYRTAKKEKDFNSIEILLSGTSSDGRKGQALALSALQDFVDNHYQKNPDKYRKVHLHLVAVGKEDYISQQIRWIASSKLSSFVTVYDSLPKEEALGVTKKCNTVLCCSLNETFGLYIAEGMLMGHVVVRNNSSGVDEQLIDGENGILIDHADIKSISNAIELLASKRTTNKDLLRMSNRSRKIINDYSLYSYIEQIEQK